MLDGLAWSSQGNGGSEEPRSWRLGQTISSLVFMLVQVDQMSAVRLQIASRRSTCLSQPGLTTLGETTYCGSVGPNLESLPLWVCTLDSTPQAGAPAAGLRPWWCVAGTQDALRCQYVWSACNSSQQQYRRTKRRVETVATKRGRIRLT